MRERFRLREIAVVGDRGMASQAALKPLRRAIRPRAISSRCGCAGTSVSVNKLLT